MDYMEFENNIRNRLQNIREQYILFGKDELRHSLESYKDTIMADLEYQCFNQLKEHGISPAEADSLLKESFATLHDSPVPMQHNAYSGYAQELKDTLKKCKKLSESLLANPEQPRMQQESTEQSWLRRLADDGVTAVTAAFNRYDSTEQSGYYWESNSKSGNPSPDFSAEQNNINRRSSAECRTDKSGSYSELNCLVKRIRELSRHDAILSEVCDPFNLLTVRSRTDLRTLISRIVIAYQSIEQLPQKIGLFESYRNYLATLPQMYYQETERIASGHSAIMNQNAEMQPEQEIIPQTFPGEAAPDAITPADTVSAFNFDAFVNRVYGQPQETDSSRKLLIEQLIELGVTPDEYRTAYEAHAHH